jgi:uncharacterized protein
LRPVPASDYVRAPGFLLEPSGESLDLTDTTRKARCSDPRVANAAREEDIMDPVTWFSIPAQDVERAAAFYNDVFGWHVQPPTKEVDAAFDYNVVLNSPSDAQFNPQQTSRVNGCIVKKATGISTPVVLVEVEDLATAAAKVAAAGGTVVSARVHMKSLNGDFILVKDPEGNMLEIFESNG